MNLWIDKVVVHMGPTNSLFLDDLSKYTRPPWHDMDEGGWVINKKIQYLGQLPISLQTVEGSSKLALISPEALQKKH